MNRYFEQVLAVSHDTHAYVNVGGCLAGAGRGEEGVGNICARMRVPCTNNGMMHGHSMDF